MIVVPFYFEYKKVIPINFNASLSYYLVLALVPSFLLIYLVSNYLIKDLTVIEEIINLILPNIYSEELIEFLNKDHLKFNPYILLIIIVCLNIESNGVKNLIRSINEIFNLENPHRVKIKSILLTLLLVLLESGLLYIATFVNSCLSVFTYLRFLILFLIVLFAFIFIYKFMPSITFKIKDVISYSIIGAFVISIIILAFNIFIDYYSKMELYYGPFSILVSVLLLFKLISNIISVVFFLQYKKYKKSSLL